MEIMFRQLINRIFLKQNGIYCFNFHEIGSKFNARMNSRGTYTDEQLFLKFLKFLKNNFTVVDVVMAFEINKSKALTDRFAVVTFDDGSASIEAAINYCISENIFASFYLNSAYIYEREIDPFKICNFLINSDISIDEKSKIRTLVQTLRSTMNPVEYKVTRDYVSTALDSNQLFQNSIYVSKDFLSSVDSKYINFGLHGHTHERFINLSRAEQKVCLTENINFVSKLKGYVPVFAIPFGRYFDWNGDTISVCNELELDFLFSDGGVNYGDGVGLRRIPADNRNIIFETRMGFFQQR